MKRKPVRRLVVIFHCKCPQCGNKETKQDYEIVTNVGAVCSKCMCDMVVEKVERKPA